MAELTDVEKALLAAQQQPEVDQPETEDTQPIAAEAAQEAAAQPAVQQVDKPLTDDEAAHRFYANRRADHLHTLAQAHAARVAERPDAHPSEHLFGFHPDKAELADPLEVNESLRALWSLHENDNLRAHVDRLASHIAALTAGSPANFSTTSTSFVDVDTPAADMPIDDQPSDTPRSKRGRKATT